MVDLGAFNSPLRVSAADELPVHGALPRRRRDSRTARRGDEQDADRRLPRLRPAGVELRPRGARRPAGAKARARSRRHPSPEPPRPDEMPWKNPGGATLRQRRLPRGLDLAVERVGYEDGTRAAGRAARQRAASSASGCRASARSPATRARRSSGSTVRASAPTRASRCAWTGPGGADISTGVSAFGQGDGDDLRADRRVAARYRSRRGRVHIGDTAGHAVQHGGFASRTMIAGAGAIEKAAGADPRQDAAHRRRHPRASTPAALEATAGGIRRRDDPPCRSRSARCREAAFLGHPLPPGEDPGLEATAYFDPPRRRSATARLSRRWR